MNAKRIKKGIKPILILFLFFSITVVVFPQEKQANQEKQLREEIITVYQSKGEEGLRDFFKKSKNQITNKFIVDFAESGMKERKEEWLKACEIMAEEKKDEKTLADVYYNIGEYFNLITNYKKAKNYLEKALQIYIKANDTLGQGSAYLSKGDMNLYTGYNSKALEMYQKALRYFAKTDHPVGKIRNSKVYIRKGILYSITGKNSKAIISFDKALSISKKSGDISGQGNAFKGKGDIYLYSGDNSNALKMYTKAQSFFEKAGDILGKGNVFKSKGNVYFRIGDTLKALEMYNKALSFFRKARDPLGQGNVYKSKGAIYSITGEILKALDMYNNAIIFYEMAGYPLGQGNVYKSKGDIYLRTGEILKAIDMYDKSLPFFEKIGDPMGQGSVYKSKGDFYFYTGDNTGALAMYDRALHLFEKAGMSVAIGDLYASKGRIYFYIGNISKALAMYTKALSLFEERGALLGQGNVYFGKGNIYLSIGNNSNALEMYEKAYHFYEKIGYSVGQGKVYRSKGTVYSYIGNENNALKMYDKALHFFEKAKEPIGKGNVYYGKGDIYLVNGNYSKALEMYNKALSFYEEIKSPKAKGNVCKRLGYIQLKTGNYSLAFEMYNKSLSFYQKCGDIESEAYSLHGKANVLAKKGKNDDAVALFEKSIFKLEKMRGQTVFSDMKQTFMEKSYQQYEETVLFMLENKFYQKGFKYAESMRSRVFLDQMAEGLVRPEKGLKSELREERDRLVGKLSALSRQMQETGGKDEKKLQQMKKEYRQVESQFEDLLIKIRLENPLYASVNYPQPVTVRDLQTDVLKKGETLLSYFISQEKAYAFIVSKGKFRVKQLKIREKEINSYVQRFLHSIKENNTNDMNRFGSLLYKKLFKPLEKYLKNSRDIIIVPAGELETIPFESLIIDKNKSGKPVYLLENYRLKYLQSASLLSILRKHYTRKSTSNGFIGFGDPVYDYENFKQGKPEQGSMKILATERIEGTKDEIKEIHHQRYARAGGIMDRLPYSGEEIKTIARLFEKESLKTVVHLREQAAEENAKAANMKDFDYIHFSCHGLLNDDFQSLVLSQLPPDKSKEDGYLTLNEIMNCDFNAKLVVLSACETGSGKMYKGEGVTGLTRAVMYAGTPAVIASLWKVDDIATKELMVMFYKNLLEKNLDKTEALRQAKLELLKNKKYRSPLFWSAFVMYGE